MGSVLLSKKVDPIMGAVKPIMMNIRKVKMAILVIVFFSINGWYKELFKNYSMMGDGKWWIDWTPILLLYYILIISLYYLTHITLLCYLTSITLLVTLLPMFRSYHGSLHNSYRCRCSLWRWVRQILLWLKY